MSDVLIKKLNYPSASAVEYFSGKLYVMGDDAPNLLVLDTNFNIIDSILIISNSSGRIPKEIKPDFEASAIYTSKQDHVVYFFGSGSLSSYRDRCLWYFIETKLKGAVSLRSLYSELKASGIEQINIEGACFAKETLILSNRGNKSYQKNHLIAIDKKFLDNDSNFHSKIIPVQMHQDTTMFSGISGMCYSEKDDKLIMSVSTENTRNSYDDGEIGKSYLWIINDFSIKIGDKTISPDRVIDLEEIDKRFKGYKIESVTMISETNELLNLVLVADNDDGSSTIFKLALKKE